MRSYLIVANQTLTGQALADAMAERLADGPIRAHVVVPLTRIGGRLTWDEVASREAAQERLDDALERLTHARGRSRRRDRRLRPGLGGPRRDARPRDRRDHRLDPAAWPLALAR